ncbi:MAG: hypothetical protein KA974_01375 [Saprospiraceae bacterium]|nr:hypothetical protein [Saprospiraceae bacterium]
MIDIQLNTITNYLSDQPIYIEITLYVETPSLNYLDIDISLVHHTSGQRIFTISKAINTLIKSTQHLHTLLLELPGNFLLPNTYSWIMALHQPNTIAYDVINNICNFTIEDAGSELSKYTDSDVGYVVVPDYKFSSIKPKKSFTD